MDYQKKEIQVRQELSFDIVKKIFVDTSSGSDYDLVIVIFKNIYDLLKRIKGDLKVKPLLVKFCEIDQIKKIYRRLEVKPNTVICIIATFMPLKIFNLGSNRFVTHSLTVFEKRDFFL